MQLKYNFMINEVAGTLVAVAVGENASEFNGFVKLNDTAAFLFDLLNEETAVEQIVSAMKNEYEGADENEIREVVLGFLAELKENGLLV